MIAFAPTNRLTQYDREERWLRGDESCRPANVRQVTDEPPPLCRFGQGEYATDYTPPQPSGDGFWAWVRRAVGL